MPRNKRIRREGVNMTFIKRLMEIKEEQLEYEEAHKRQLDQIIIGLRQILKVLKGGKDGKRKISRKNIVSNRFGRR